MLFHEPELLGAGTSFLRAAGPLREFGWSPSGWIPGSGPLGAEAKTALDEVAEATRPLAFSVRGWTEAPGLRARLRASPAYLRAVRAALLRIRPNVVHANTLLTLPEALVARSLGLPVVIQVHELPRPGAKRAATLRTACRVADVVVAVSEAVRRLLLPHAGSTPILRVYNGVPASERDPADQQESFVVGTIGTVSRLKGTDVFLRAARLAHESRPAVRFEHVGQTGLHRDAGFDDELAGLLSEPGMDDAVTMLGRGRSDDALARWHAFVMPSRQEAFPLATLEAMAAGVPVVASRVGGIPEQIVDGASGLLVASDDAAGIADAVVRLHDDPGYRDGIGRAGRKRVRSDFTVARQAEGLHEAYLAALALRFGPPQVRAATRPRLRGEHAVS